MKTVLKLGFIPLLMVGCSQAATDLSSSAASVGVSSTDEANVSKVDTRADVTVASCAKPPKPQPTDPEACLHLDAALIGLDSTEVSFSGNATVDGNAYIGSRSSFKGSGSSVINGVLWSGSRSNSVRLTGNSSIRGGVKSLSTDVDGTLTRFSREMSQLRSTLTLNSIEKSAVINGAGGVNVVRVRGAIRLSGNNSLILKGSAADTFILNVDDELQMSGNSSIVLAGGVSADHVLINLLGGGCHDGIKLSGSSLVNGTILGADRSAQISGNGRINGALVAADRIQISGNGFAMKSALFCSNTPAPGPSPAPSPEPTPVPPKVDPTPAPPVPTPMPTPVPPVATPVPTPAPPAPTPVPPVAGAVITNFSVVENFFDGFNAQWTTSEGATSQVMWTDPLTGESGVTALDATLETNHLIHISGLNSSTDYELRAISKNAAGVTTTSAVLKARTAD